MKPTKLTMKAFGSYADETTINFADFPNGLYLIVGKTGAGKTTIFDAITFALFGVPSGSERTTDMLHSDYIDKSVDTVVKLSFIHQGRVYQIERSIHFAKERGGEGFREGKVSATMTWDREAIEGATTVTARCTELLGLNAEQFRRIVMLAQGEFREFLKAGSEKKNEILGKLFDNTEYVRFQTLFSSVQTKLQQQRAEKNSEIESALKMLSPEDAGREEFLAGNLHLVDNLRALVALDMQRLERLQQESNTKSQAVDTLTRQEGAAESDNALLDEMEEKKALYAALEEKKEQIEAQAKEYDAAERSLHFVKPSADTLDRAISSLQQTHEEIAKKETLLVEQKKAETNAQKTVDEDDTKRQQAGSLSTEAKNLEDSLPHYDKLDRMLADFSSLKTKLKEESNSAEQLDAQRKTAKEELKALREEIKALEGAEAEAERLKQERGEAEARFNAVAKTEGGIAAQTEEILLSEKGLKAELEVLHELTTKAADAEKKHHLLYQSFLSGQAGLIAADIEKELAETGRAVCPVCNSAFCRGDDHHFALPAEDIPTQTEVDLAQTAAKNAEKQRQEKHTFIERQQATLEQKKKSVAEAMREIDPSCVDWDYLTAPGYLAEINEQLEAAYFMAKQDYSDADIRSCRRKSLLEQEPEKSSSLESLETQCGEAQKNIEHLKQDIRGSESAVEQFRARLSCADKAAAQKKLEALNKQKNDLRAEINAHDHALADAKQAVSETEGGLRTLKESLPKLKKDVEDAGNALADKLRETDFPDRDAAAAALIPIGSMDGETWLKERRQRLDAYANDVKNTSRRIEELTERTKGKMHVDLASLKERLREAKEEQTAAQDAVTEQSNVTNGHKKVLAQVGTAKVALAATDRAWHRISRLASLAGGANSDVGKLSFDRYVMGAIFREVLEMANRRLDIMTGGRFELIHVVDAGRKNSIAGLELEVLDRGTGKQRAAGSISGGEGFLVSLALALGLSDVVQNHAGGQKLDTLFIDEGFGTLDDGKLDNVIAVLQQLSEGNRLVGVISHVDKLEESIPQKLRITSGAHGSSIAVELS